MPARCRYENTDFIRACNRIIKFINPRIILIQSSLVLRYEAAFSHREGNALKKIFKNAPDRPSVRQPAKIPAFSGDRGENVLGNYLLKDPGFPVLKIDDRRPIITAGTDKAPYQYQDLQELTLPPCESLPKRSASNPRSAPAPTAEKHPDFPMFLWDLFR